MLNDQVDSLVRPQITQNGADYGTLLTELKTRIHTAQYTALRAVNKELIALYWDIGKLIEERQEAEGWGKAVVERLSADLRAEFSEKSGFSGRNLWYMRTFYREYKEQPILQPLAAEISWTKNTLILDRCRNPLQREFYLRALPALAGHAGCWSTRSTTRPTKNTYSTRPASIAPCRKPSPHKPSWRSRITTPSTFLSSPTHTRSGNSKPP